MNDDAAASASAAATWRRQSVPRDARGERRVGRVIEQV